MAHQIFGNSAAEHDELLHDCWVDHASPVAKRPILMGRWGTGKSAFVFTDGYQLSQSLEELKPGSGRAWYIGEERFDIQALQTLKTAMAGDQALLVRSLEAAWRAEIVRTYCAVLSLMAKTYSTTTGEHWKFVRGLAASDLGVKGVWQHVGHIVGIITGDPERVHATDDLKASLSKMLEDHALSMISRCLHDIDLGAGELAPLVAVEPIETPTSAVERSDSLANDMVAALLNLYERSLQPTDENLLDVRITIPWHRYDRSKLDAPQKIRQYVGSITWPYTLLRDFIDRRIEWEFKRVGRRFTPKGHRDAWVELFGTSVPNAVTKPRVHEPSFSYVVRHTHHRPRDLQTLARAVVFSQAEISGKSVDDVLKSGKVEEATIQRTMISEGHDSTEELLVEARRRYRELPKIEGALRGLPMPFSSANLKKRLERVGVDFNEGVSVLWESGVLGVCAAPISEKGSRHLAALSPNAKECKRLYRNEDDESLERWCWHEYNYADAPSMLIDNLEKLQDVEASLTLHSKTIEYFGPASIDEAAPIGV